MAFSSDSMDLPRLCQGGWHPELDIPHEGLDCCESSVARGRGVAALFLDVSEKAESKGGIDLFEADL
jgi:hypothetical protein